MGLTLPCVKPNGYRFSLQDHGQGMSSVPGGCTETPSSLGLQPKTQGETGPYACCFLATSQRLVTSAELHVAPTPKGAGRWGGVERKWLGHPTIQAPVRPRQWLQMYRGALQPGGSESGDTVRSLSGSPTSTVTTTDSTGR